ncbi:hypothetical protein IGI39_004575 [Enterococcus sp. AZ135]|uniref:SemiSWEET transporter n=1 Tax=unclassified Enterococcus TaxID=2608891 RepID=UPI003F294081
MIGSIAGLLTTIAFVPQVIKILKTKDTRSIAFETCLLQVVGVFLWIIHGLVQSDFAIIMANGVTLCLTSIILVCKLISRKREAEVRTNALKEK